MHPSKIRKHSTKDNNSKSNSEESFLENEKEEEILFKSLLNEEEDLEKDPTSQFSSFEIDNSIAKSVNTKKMKRKMIIIAAIVVTAFLFMSTFSKTRKIHSETVESESVESLLSSYISNISNHNDQQKALLWLANSDDGRLQARDSYGLLQRFQLAALYISTNGDDWKHNDEWQSNESVCNWHGVTCDDGGVVNSLDLRKHFFVFLFFFPPTWGLIKYDFLYF